MNGKILRILTSRATVPCLVGAGIFSAGVAVGMVVSELLKKEEEYLGEVIDIDVEELAKDDGQLKFDELDAVDDDVPPGVLSFIDKIKDRKVGDPAPIEEGDRVITIERHLEEHEAAAHVRELERRTVFDGHSIDGWDYEDEMGKREDQAIFVLHVDEFMADERGLTQMTLTYYAGDDILVDEQNVPIYNYEEKTGPLLFGHGSNDPSVFYVRNLELGAEYEITRDEGSYALEVLGHEIELEDERRELRHSAVPKFRSRE